MMYGAIEWFGGRLALHVHASYSYSQMIQGRVIRVIQV